MNFKHGYHTFLRFSRLLVDHPVPVISFDHLSSLLLTVKTLTRKWTSELLLEGEKVLVSFQLRSKKRNRCLDFVQFYRLCLQRVIFESKTLSVSSSLDGG